MENRESRAKYMREYRLRTGRTRRSYAEELKVREQVGTSEWYQVMRDMLTEIRAGEAEEQTGVEMVVKEEDGEPHEIEERWYQRVEREVQ